MDSKKSLFVTKSFLPSRELFDSYLDAIWNDSVLTNNGPLHNKLKQELSVFFGGSHVTLTTNGHLGLDVALHVLGIAGEVITTPFTFASTAHALTWRGLVPVFCDIKECDLTLDPNKVEALITERTTAIMPVHVYGNPCEVDKIAQIAEKYNLKVIYDAAHAFGVSIGEKSIAYYGDVSMFSFHATKLFHTIEGGALVYNDHELEHIYEASRNFGFFKGENVFAGTNAKMSEFQAAMGLCNLLQIHQIIDERKQIVQRYRNLLDGVCGIRYVGGDDTLDVRHNYSYMPILIDELGFGRTRNEVFEALEKQEINCRKYFFPLISDYKCYAGQHSSANTPIAAKIAEQVLCLPIFNGMELSDVDRVCSVILNL